MKHFSTSTESVLNYLVVCATGLQLSSVPYDRQSEAIDQAIDQFMTYLQRYFSMNNFAKEQTRLTYALRTGQPVFTTMKGFSDKLEDAFAAYLQFCNVPFTA